METPTCDVTGGQTLKWKIVTSHLASSCKTKNTHKTERLGGSVPNDVLTFAHAVYAVEDVAGRTLTAEGAHQVDAAVARTRPVWPLALIDVCQRVCRSIQWRSIFQEEIATSLNSEFPLSSQVMFRAL